MKTVVIAFLTGMAVVILSSAAIADWDPSMPTKYMQMPDLNWAGGMTGMDVNATWQMTPVGPPQPVFPFMKVLADDFPCRNTGPITGIHVWGSWLNDQFNPNTTFHVSIHADVPRGPNGMYSHPGNVLWEQDFFPDTYIARPWANAEELFYDPNTNEIIGMDTLVWQYNFVIPRTLAFVQQGTAANPMTYWLDVQAMVPGPQVFGWKTSMDHWNDDAVFADTDLPLSMGGQLIGPAPAPVFWADMHYPVNHPFAGQSIDLAFAITTEPAPHPGDANIDGAVDVVDLGILATNYDTLIGATWAMGDFTGDGAVDVVDLGILATNYDWVGAGSPVPEPATLSLLALGGLAVIRRRK